MIIHQSNIISSSFVHSYDRTFSELSLENSFLSSILILIQHFVWPDSDLRYQTIYTVLKTVQKFLLLNDYVSSCDFRRDASNFPSQAGIAVVNALKRHENT